MSDRALMAAEKDNQSLRSILKRQKDKAKAASTQLVQTAAGVGAGFAVSYVEARYPDKAQVGTIPLSLLAGGVATVAGAMEWVGDQQTSGIVLAAGQGMLIAYAAKMGSEKGAEARQAAA